MKKILISAILPVFLTEIGFSQNRASTLNEGPSAEKKISWQAAIVQDLPGMGKYSLLNFEKAVYDLEKHFFPVFSERYSLPAGSSEVNAKIYNETYAPLTQEEQTAINSYGNKKVLPEIILPEATVAYYKKKPYAYISFVPLRKNKTTGAYEKLLSFSIEVVPSSAQKTFIPKRMYASTSVLANGMWHKVSVMNDGIYKMDYFFLKNLGLGVDSIATQNIRVYGNGGGQLAYSNATYRPDDLQENAIYVYDKDNDGKLDSADYVLFYGQSQHRWKYNATEQRFTHSLNIYSDTTYYFVTADLGPGKRIQTQSSSPSFNTTVNSFNDYLFHEAELVNLLKSGRQWLGETFDILNTYNFTFTFPNIDVSSKVFVKVEAGARRDNPGTNFSWTAGGFSSSFTVPPVVTASIYTTYHRISSDTLSFFPSSSTIPVSITKTTPSPAIGWLNYIELNARRNLAMNGTQMFFRDANSVGAGNVARFVLSNASPSLQVWDVTDPINVKLQQTNFSGGTLEFNLPTDSLKEFVAFNGLSFLTPKISGPVPNQDLHSIQQADYIIVTHPLFLSQANDLAELHRVQDNMSVSVVTTQQVYNEFSSGAQDVSAIRDFVKMLYDRSSDDIPAPQYLLLFGRGSYNLKGAVNNTNFVPSYQSLNSTEPTTSYASDDFYGFLDDTEGNWDVTADVLDLGVGRIPVKTVSEADIVLKKIIKYTSVPGTIETGNSCATDVCYGLGDWINTVVFIADDEDNSTHLDQANQLAAKIEANNKLYNIEKIYFDAYQQVATPGGERYPDATEAFNKRMDRGSLIVNYTGHGGELGWAHERFLEIYHINSWKNQCKLPIFFTATCEFSRWDDPARTSAGELALLNGEGGAVGLMSTTRVVYSGPNYTLNSYFYDHIFDLMDNGKMPRLGDLHMLTKNDMSPALINQRNFSLLGDPALSLNYPEYDVKTTKINGAPVDPVNPDTARALSTVSVEGEVHDRNGNLMSTFNGIIYATVFDKSAKITTLMNDGPSASPQRTFMLQKNALFKGKASVANGKFSFSFIVPKDIAYNFGRGKISYYAHNGYEDASGYSSDIIIGGTDTNAVTDAAGPDVKLYLNDEKFVFGGITNADPKIYVVVSDSSGINTAGTSIGHDITAVLDNDNTHPFVLNDYYESDLNNFKKGSVRYPLSKLEEGKHTLSVKVWDVHNNSSSAYTEFVVASSADVALKHVLNYPNPFTTKTSFYFEHNQCCVTMDVQVQIFTVSGKLVKTIQQLVNMEGYRSAPIEWDGTDDFGDKIGRGVYVYRLRVKAGTKIAEQFEKLVILK